MQLTVVKWSAERGNTRIAECAECATVLVEPPLTNKPKVLYNCAGGAGGGGRYVNQLQHLNSPHAHHISSQSVCVM